MAKSFAKETVTPACRNRYADRVSDAVFSAKNVLTVGPQGFGTYRAAWLSASQDWEFSAPTGPAELALVPGFVDMHIHGAFGVDFMTATPPELVQMAHELRQVGYQALTPTTVTASLAATKTAVSHAKAASMFVGFHLEGPFISPKHPGAQPSSFIQPIPSGQSEWDTLLDDPGLRQITLAPELAGADALITRLSSRGVVVSMGHTDATYDQIEHAVSLGASQTTHTYNAMRPLHHREAGTVGAALLDSDIYTELIYDRIHVSKAAASLLVRCKPIDRLIAVSDSTMAAGMPVGTELKMWGLDVVVGEKQVRLRDGTLAGSGITLLDAFQNLWEDFGLETAIYACSINPGRRLGITPTLWNLFNLEGQIIQQLESGEKSADF